MKSIVHIRVKASHGDAVPASKSRLPMQTCGCLGYGRSDVSAENNIVEMLKGDMGESITHSRLKCPSFLDFDRYLCLVRRLCSICADYTDYIEPAGLDGIFLDVSASPVSPEELVDALRILARKELGFELRAGISFNKAFARLASNMNASSGATTITRENFRQKVWVRSVGELMYVDESMQSQLAKLGIHTIGDLACVDVKLMNKAFGIQGELLRQVARGNDSTPVLNEGIAALGKCMGSSIVAPWELRRDIDVELLLQLLCDSIAEQLRSFDLLGSTVSLCVSDCHRDLHCFQQRLARPIARAGDILAVAHSLFRENWSWGHPIRGLKLSVGILSCKGSSIQLNLIPKSKCELEDTVGDLRRRFGHGIISRGSMIRSIHNNTIHPGICKADGPSYSQIQ